MTSLTIGPSHLARSPPEPGISGGLPEGASGACLGKGGMSHTCEAWGCSEAKARH